MKQIILLFSFLTCFAVAWAQEGDNQQPPRQNNAEIVRKIFIGHMTKQLNLTESEAQQFWPVFNNYEGEWRGVLKQNGEDVIKRDAALLELKKKYKPDFQRVLSNSEPRANKVFMVHDKFMINLRNMMEKRQERRGNNPPNRPVLQRKGERRNV
jgi:Spy/CpxP family protein refolding chaperone